MRAALALLQAGAVRTDELITHRFGLEETGMALAAQRDGRALKAVVLPAGEPRTSRAASRH
jgi:L-iditol 2-dehydrogenase